MAATIALVAGAGARRSTPRRPSDGDADVVAIGPAPAPPQATAAPSTASPGLRWDERIAEDCDELVRIADSCSRTYGSGWTRDRASTLGKPTAEYVLNGADRGTDLVAAEVER